MKILLLGGTGWLGHSIAEILAARKMDVTILCRGKRKTFLEDVAGIRMLQVDKTDEAAMKAVLEKGRYTHIIDTVPTTPSIDNIYKYARGIRHYIHCSSTGGYTPLPAIPGNESSPYHGFQRGTGWDQKRIVDSQVMNLFHSEGFPATVIRPCYITGPGMLPLDNLGDRRKDFIPDIIAEKTLDLPDAGQALLQPIHVKDLAMSFYLALMHPLSIGQVYNICLDHAVTLNRYLELNAGAFGKKAHISYLPLQEMRKKYEGLTNDIGLQFLAEHMCFTIEKAKRELEYVPAHSPEEAIEETALWAAKQVL